LKPAAVLGAALTITGCEAFALAPIELDVSSNCNVVEAVVTAAGVQSPARPWEAVVAASADRPGAPSAWLLVVRTSSSGTDQLALLHVDEALSIDREVILDAPAGLAEQFEFVASGAPGIVYLTQRAPGTFYVRRYDANQPTPLSASSPNLATLPAPCDLDADGTFESCDASDWSQDLVFFGQDRQPFALTFPPSTESFAIEITPTPLDPFLSPAFPLDPDRTIVFAERCDEDLPVTDFEACQALVQQRSYPKLRSLGLRSDLPRGFTMLALYRETQLSDGLARVADVPIVLLGTGDLGAPSGILQVDLQLPAPRDTPPHGVAVDANATYVHYTATDGAPVLTRATRAPPELERLDGRFDFPEGAELLQLDDDIALHRIVDGAWEILKLFPDAPTRSETTIVTLDAPVVGIRPAGPATFLVQREDGVADLVHVRCAVPTPE
jgi:hypothetical protein